MCMLSDYWPLCFTEYPIPSSPSNILASSWKLLIKDVIHLTLAEQSESCRKRERWTWGIQEWSCGISQHGECHYKTKKCLISEIHVSDLVLFQTNIIIWWVIVPWKGEKTEKVVRLKLNHQFSWNLEKMLGFMDK